jgi:hypothetical protein
MPVYMIQHPLHPGMRRLFFAATRHSTQNTSRALHHQALHHKCLFIVAAE